MQGSQTDSTMPLPEPRRPIEVFYSYAHKDKESLEELIKHLTPLEREHRISGWYDRNIGIGDDWNRAINNHLNTAHIILLLVSQDFIASRYCHSVEMKRAEERYEDGEARVIAIILRPCGWQRDPFIGKLQALPTGGQPVMKWENRDDAFHNVQEEIRIIIDEIDRALLQRSGQKPRETKEQWVEQGYTYYENKNLPQALYAFNDAIRLDTNFVYAYIGKGKVLIDLERCEEALVAFEQALGLDPQSAPAYVGKGSALIGLKRYEGALAAFEQALNFDPASFDAYKGKSNALECIRYSQLDPDNAQPKQGNDIDTLRPHSSPNIPTPVPASHITTEQNNGSKRKVPFRLTFLSKWKAGGHPKSTYRRSIVFVLVPIIILLAVIALPFIYVIHQIHLPNTCSSSTTTSTTPMPLPPNGIDAHGIGVSLAPDNTQGYIGISNGNYIFAQHRGNDKQYEIARKVLAAEDFTNGNLTAAENELQTAVNLDPSDAEAQIYLEDVKVLMSGKPYITIIVAAMLTGSPNNTRPEDLQGAYIAQKEYNENAQRSNGKSLYLLIANSGSNDDYQSITRVAQQIVQVTQQDPSFLAVVGWPNSQASLYAQSVLQAKHILMISSTASSNDLKGPGFFRIAPRDSDQGLAGAYYASQILKKNTVAILYDPCNAYSKTLAINFLNEFQKFPPGTAFLETYSKGDQKSVRDSLAKALQHTPKVDLLYFSGYAADFDEVRGKLLSDPQNANLTVMGGDGLYNLSGYTSNHYQHLYFTAFAYPDMWGSLTPPSFFTEYPRTFDPHNQHPGQYGFSRADSNSILTYDATFALLQGYANAPSKGNIQDNLPAALAKLSIQGASGQIDLRAANGNPKDKIVVLLYVDRCGQTHEVAIRGSLQLGKHIEKGPLYPVPPPTSCTTDNIGSP